MKSFVMACYLMSTSLGNAITFIVNLAILNEDVRHADPHHHAFAPIYCPSLLPPPTAPPYYPSLLPLPTTLPYYPTLPPC